MLEHITKKYDLPIIDKAMRCVLDFVALDGDWDDIFSIRRCIRCGGKPGWEEK